MGGSVAWALARAGERCVTLIDAGYPRSSWGESRISRLAYADALYIRLMRRGFALWDALAKESGRELLKRVPCLDIGDAGMPSLGGLSRTYKDLGMEYEELSAAEVSARYPQIRLLPTERAVLQKDAGVLLADRCVAALEEVSEARGVECVSGTAVAAIDRVCKTVTTEDGNVYSYSTLVLCAGPWTNSLLRAAGLPLLPLLVTNEQSVYYEVDESYKGPAYDADAGMPVILEHWPRADAHAKRAGLYAIPHVGGIPGVKIGIHRDGTLLQNEEFVVREDSARDLRYLPNTSKVFNAGRSDGLDPGPKAKCDAFVAARLPGVCLEGSHHLRCLYTQTSLADEDFLVGRHPSDPDVVVACGFGGEGFKFGTAIGSLVAELVVRAPPTLPEALERFCLARALPPL